MMHHLNAKEMLYYKKLLYINYIYSMLKSCGYFYLKLNHKINKRFILLPDNDSVDVYTSPFKEIKHHVLAYK